MYNYPTPLFYTYGPRRQRGRQYGLFFEFGEDLLGAVCSATKQYSPFSPWESTYFVPNLRRFKEQAKDEEIPVKRIDSSRQALQTDYGPLSELRGAVEDWRRRIVRLHGPALQWTFKFNYGFRPGAKELRADLIATMDFLLEKIDDAQECGNTISVIGF